MEPQPDFSNIDYITIRRGKHTDDRIDVDVNAHIEDAVSRPEKCDISPNSISIQELERADPIPNLHKKFIVPSVERQAFISAINWRLDAEQPIRIVDRRQPIRVLDRRQPQISKAKGLRVES